MALTSFVFFIDGYVLHTHKYAQIRTIIIGLVNFVFTFDGSVSHTHTRTHIHTHTIVGLGSAVSAFDGPVSRLVADGNGNIMKEKVATLR